MLGSSSFCVGGKIIITCRKGPATIIHSHWCSTNRLLTCTKAVSRIVQIAKRPITQHTDRSIRRISSLDGRCPFRHDIKTMQDAREKIFEERRDYMRCPTTDQMNKGTMLHKDAFAKVHNFDKFEDLPDKIKNKFRQPCFRALCAYPECGKAWLITEERSPLRSCGKCDWAYYCSVRICSSLLFAYWD